MPTSKSEQLLALSSSPAISAGLRLRGGWDALLSNEILLATGTILVAIIAQIELFGFLAKRKLLPSVVTRKLTHIFAGSTMLTCFALFPVGQSWVGRLVVASFLCSFIVAFSLIAYIPEEELVRLPKFLQVRIASIQSMACRTGRREELCRGTLLYCAITAIVICLLWTSPASVITLSCLFLGDGLADPVGRLLGRPAILQYRVGWFGKKSYPGSLAFFLSSLAGSFLWGRLFLAAGHYDRTLFQEEAFLRAAAVCALVATVAEGISPPEVDNILIPLATLLTSYGLQASGSVPFLFHTLG